MGKYIFFRSYSLYLRDYRVYLVIACIVVAIICAISIPIIKKDKEKLKKLKAQVPKEKLDKLKEFKFENDESLGKSMYVGTGIIADIIENKKNVKVLVMFYNAPRAEIYSQTATLTIDEYNNKNLNQLDYIKCAMKYDKDMFVYKLKKII